MVCYTGTEAKEKLKGVPVEVVWEGGKPQKESNLLLPALLILVGVLFLLDRGKS
jgi:hypothetical protein